MMTLKTEERESIVLENEGQKIFGVLHLPVGAVRSPAVLICHGLAGDKTGKHRVYVLLAKLLAENGIASLRIDFRGSGDSEGDFSDMTLEGEVSDALKAIQFLRDHPRIEQDRLGIFGRSVGGSVAVITAHRDQHIKSLVTWAPLSDGDQWRNQWKQLNQSNISQEDREASMRVNGQIPGKAFFQQLFNLQIEEELDGLSNIPFLHIHGEKDNVVLIDHADKYVKYRENVNGATKFIRLPKGDHDFSDPKEQKIALSETSQWFKDTL